MNYIQHKAKHALEVTIADVLRSYIISPRELEQVLISLAGDIAVDEASLVTFPRCNCPVVNGEVFHSVGCIDSIPVGHSRHP